MKLLKAIIAAAILAALPSSLYSIDVSAGITTWYSMWWPEFEGSYRGEGNGISRYPGNSSAYNDSFDVDTSLMAGPVVTLKLTDKWSLGFVFLLSMKTGAEGSYDVFHDDAFAGWDFTFTQKSRMDFRRYDSDVTLTYRPGGTFSYFGGIKYFGWNGSGGTDLATAGSANYDYTSHSAIEVTGHNIGPAMGVNCVNMITGMFFFTASLSGLVLYSRTEQAMSTEWTEYNSAAVPTTSSGSSRTESIESSYYLGFNSSVGIGYYFESHALTLIVGGRCQYLHGPGKDPDIFGGATLSVMRSF